MWFIVSEKRNKSQYSAGGKRRTIRDKARREVVLKPRDAVAKRNTKTLEKSRKASDIFGDFLRPHVGGKSPGCQFKTIERVNLENFR